MRLRSSLLSFSFASLTFFFSNIALAGDAVVVPLYSPNLPAGKVGNITSLITSEVDFSGRYDMVFPADSRPKTLTPKCLKSVPCLRPIAEGEGVTSMVTGSVTKIGSELEFFVVLYEDSKIIRMKRFRITDDPLSLASDVGSYIQEVVTGKAVEKEEEETLGTAPIAADVLDEEDDIFGGSEDPLGDFSLDPAEEERLAEQKAAEERARQEEARRAEEEQRRKEMEEQARRLAMEAEAKRLAEQAMADDSQDEEDDFDFNFAPSTVEVVEEENGEDNDVDFSFDEPKPTREKTKSKPKSKPKKEFKPSRDFDSSSSRTNNSSSVRSGRIDAAATLTGKVGGGNFQTLNFVTYGGEVGIHLSESISVHVGGEGYATNQAMPVLDEDGEPTDVLQQSWRVLIPISLGVEYHFEGKMAKPYVGADMQILPAYAGTGSGAAVGLRGRAGSNFMVANGFGINLNVAFGFWSGQYFRQVPSPAGGTLNPSGLTPQITLGPVIAF
jgi:hypothetical protein